MLHKQYTLPTILLIVVIMVILGCLGIVLFPYLRPCLHHSSEEVSRPTNYLLWNILCTVKRDLTKMAVIPASQSEYDVFFSNNIMRCGFADRLNQYQMSYLYKDSNSEYTIVVVISNVLSHIVLSSTNDYPLFCFSNDIARIQMRDTLLQELGMQPHFTDVQLTAEKMSMLTFIGYDRIIVKYLEGRIGDTHENRDVILLARRLLYCQSKMRPGTECDALF